MNLPKWNTHSDPDYRHVRGLILKFFTAVTGRLYIDGRLTADQEDDVQDAFLAYFEKILPVSHPNYSDEVRLYFEVLDIRKRREDESRMTIGGVRVPRRKVPIDSDGFCPEPREVSTIETDPEDDPEPRGHSLVSSESAEKSLERAELGILFDAVRLKLSPQEKTVLLNYYVRGMRIVEIATRLRLSDNAVRKSLERGISKMARLIH